MPDPRPLERLRSLLAAEFSGASPSHNTTWGDPKAMTDVLRELKRSLGGDGLDRPQRDVLVEAVRAFGQHRKVSSPRQLKYVCYGVTLPVEPAQWRIIDRSEVFDALLHEVQGQQANPRQFRRCYQGLLSGYFGFDRHSRPEGTANRHWLTLRGFLGDRLDPLLAASRQRQQSPQWLEILGEHRNLLQDDPCSRYANALKQGNSQELKQVCAGLGIENTSWVWEEALLAYVLSVVKGQDASFKAGLGGVLNLVNDRAEWRLPPSVAIRATAMTIARYADCSDQPEHPVLRDTCLHRIGNPWLERTAWDAHVRYEPAREMVESWLKRRLIRDFFELLSHDGAADQRRLNYWIEWEPLIADMWFVLGKDALRNKSPAFMELRKRMAGRERWLEGSDDGNNAFIMRIGPLLVVEFGRTGNACYAYDASTSNINLDLRALSLSILKRRYHKSLKVWLSHNGGWEPRFDYEFRTLLGRLPRDLKKRGISQIGGDRGSTTNPWLVEAAPRQEAPVVPFKLASVSTPAMPLVEKPSTQEVADRPAGLAEKAPTPTPPTPSPAGAWRAPTSSDGSQRALPLESRPGSHASTSTAMAGNPDMPGMGGEAAPLSVSGAEALGPASTAKPVGVDASRSMPMQAAQAGTSGTAKGGAAGPQDDRSPAIPRDRSPSGQYAFTWPAFRSPDEPAPVPKPGVFAREHPKPISKRVPFFDATQLESLRARCAAMGVKWEDNRPRGGALWVLIPERQQHVGLSAVLESYGFRYKAGRGFWLERDD